MRAYKKVRNSFRETGEKGDPCYIVAESLVRLSPVVMWKVKNVPGVPGDLRRFLKPRATNSHSWSGVGMSLNQEHLTCS